MSLVRAGAIAGGSAGPSWHPLDISPAVFVSVDAAYITVISDRISAAANQGTAGGTFTQATEFSRPPYALDHFGAGKHAAEFAGTQQLTMTHTIASADVITIFSVSIGDATASARCMVGWGDTGAPEVWHGCDATPEWYGLHQRDAGYSARRAGIACDAITPRVVITEHKISASNPEITVWVDNDAASNADVFTANNTSAFDGAWSWTIGARAGTATFPWVGFVRAFGAVLGTVSGADRALLQSWGESELGI